MKRVVAALGLALGTVACSSGTAPSASSGASVAASSTEVVSTTAAVSATAVPTTTSPSDSASTVVDTASDRLTAADVQALIDGALATDPWVSSVVGVSEATVLRRPVVRIALSDQNAVNDAMNALQTALQSTLVSVEKWGVLEISGPDFTAFGAIGLHSFEPVDLPTPAASGEEFLSWLNQAFGAGSPAPEDWVAHVTSTGFASSLPTGYTNVLVIQTDLPWDADGHRIAAEISQAIDAAAPPFAASFTIYYADANYESSGDIVPAIGQFGYQS